MYYTLHLISEYLSNRDRLRRPTPCIYRIPIMIILYVIRFFVYSWIFVLSLLIPIPYGGIINNPLVTAYRFTKCIEDNSNAKHDMRLYGKTIQCPGSKQEAYDWLEEESTFHGIVFAFWNEYDAEFMNGISIPYKTF